MHDFEGSGHDLSMYLYSTLGEKLITRATGLAIAKMVLQDRFGPQEVVAQEPFDIKDEDGTWVIKGSRRQHWDDGRTRDAMRHGKAEVVISQFDGRILKLSIETPLPPVE